MTRPFISVEDYITVLRDVRIVVWVRTKLLWVGAGSRFRVRYHKINNYGGGYRLLWGINEISVLQCWNHTWCKQLFPMSILHSRRRSSVVVKVARTYMHLKVLNIILLLFVHVLGREGMNATGLHLLEFRKFAMVLSDSQIELLALTLDIQERNTTALANQLRKELPNRMNLFMSHVMRAPLAKNPALRTQPCAWNMLLSRRCVLHLVEW